MSIHPSECREVIIHATETMSCNTWVGILWHKCTDLRTNRSQKPHWFLQAPGGYLDERVSVNSQWKSLRTWGVSYVPPGWIFLYLTTFSGALKKMLTNWKVILYLLLFCSKWLHCSSQKIGHKRVMLFTNNDNPHADNPSLQVRIPFTMYSLEFKKDKINMVLIKFFMP